MKRKLFSVLKALLCLLCALVSGAAALPLVGGMFLGSSGAFQAPQPVREDYAVMDRFDMNMHNAVSTALEGVLSLEKVYWLKDSDLVAPRPDPARYGQTDDPSQLQWLLDQAQPLLDGQDTLFHTGVELAPGTTVRYYLDDTILAITWKQVLDNVMYTISEIKIAHPSQFRRFLAGGEYGSGKRMITTDMASDVNAVVASSGDFYGFRRVGIHVYNGGVYRVGSGNVDVCLIDENGDLQFLRRGEITDQAGAEAYVQENRIRFSLAFGPIIVENGQRCDPTSYSLGEIRDGYARSALCQRDKLHYYLVTANSENGYSTLPTLAAFAGRVHSFGCKMAYTLDGGQTAVIAMDGEMINRVQFGYQRTISDIIYFATAIPNGA